MLTIPTFYMPKFGDDDAPIIMISFGTTGYHHTDYDQQQADGLNAMQGNTPAELKAAESCSMSGNWEMFHNTVKLRS